MENVMHISRFELGWLVAILLALAAVFAWLGNSMSAFAWFLFAGAATGAYWAADPPAKKIPPREKRQQEGGT